MDNLTPNQRRLNMQNIRSKGTLPERIIMSALKAEGIYFSSHAKNIVGCPDIIFRRKKIVVFIDSDFWHGHSSRFILPKTNTDYWQQKIKNNKQRARFVNKKLKEQGWKILHIWEYDIKHNPTRCVRKIISTLKLENSSYKSRDILLSNKGDI